MFATKSSSQSMYHYIGPFASKYMGKIGALWDFPSDHLPVGITLNNHRFATWNVLNQRHFEYIENNKQGLVGSVITQENHSSDKYGVADGKNESVITERGNKTTPTRREEHTAELVCKMLETHSLIALQECGVWFVQILKKLIPPHIKMVKYLSYTSPRRDNMIVYHSHKLNLCRIYPGGPGTTKAPEGAYGPESDRPVINVTFTGKNGEPYRIINTHGPGDAEHPEVLAQLARYASAETQGKEVTLCMGDMNFDENLVGQAFVGGRIISKPCSLFSPYKTIITSQKGQEGFSKNLDHIAVIGDVDSNSIEVSAPESLIKGLDKLVKLLGEKPKRPPQA